MWTIDVFALSDFSRSESAKFLHGKILYTDKSFDMYV